MARFCTECGKEISAGMSFCTECGAKAPAEMPPKEPAQPVAASDSSNAQKSDNRFVRQQPAYTAPVTVAVSDESVKGTKYEPVSTGGFIGIILLMSIPVIGLILTVVWACGGCRKLTKRSFARAYLILMAVALVISLVLGLVFSSFAGALTGLGIGDIIGREGLLSGQKEKDEDSSSDILDILEGLGSKETSQLGEIADALEDIQGAEGIDGVLENIENENEKIQAQNSGWPKELRPYPGGKQVSVTTYRTEITETTPEDMFAYIEELKKDGYEYSDFYEFGFSEEDMKSINGWWGTNGKIYLGISYSEGTVTVDHTYELPDINDYFG